MYWDVAVSVHPLEYVLWYRSCWSCLHPPRFAYSCFVNLLSTSVYQKLGYTKLFGRAAELSMCASVEVQAIPDYSTKGEVQMTAM